MKRRTFIGAALLAASAAAPNAAAFGRNVITTEDLVLKRVTLSYRTLPPDLEGFRFGFLSDFHLGGWVKTSLVERSLRLIHAEGVDLLLHGGDYIWVPDTYGRGTFDTVINDSFTGSSDEELAESIFDRISALAAPLAFPYGSYGVLGNHDRWSSGAACYEYLPRGNIAVLENKTAKIGRGSATIEIFGSADYWTGIPELPSFSTGPNIFRVLLTHNPDFASYCHHMKRIPFHLSLSGHTHGGQIRLPIVGPLTYNIEDARYGDGLTDYGEKKLYTSRGIGVVEVPFRICCPPEAVVFTLVRG